MSEFQLAIFIFCTGAVVTLATLAMILKGHYYWKDRDPFDRVR